ncbi:MAG: M42 family peptidase [Oscillospiraceae bacterium]|nr:M42 family peptidase [Oscillospiraceae bacterium]
MTDTLKTLCYLSGVSGAEDETRDYILERAMPEADEISTDALGNVSVYKHGEKSKGPHIMLCAHMDEVGLIITGADDGGFLRFETTGGTDRRVLPGKRVYVGPDRIPGVICMEIKRPADKDERKKMPQTDDMFIDVGADKKSRAEELINPGCAAVFDDGIVEFGDGFIKAKALDDRIGCAIMLKLLEEDLPCGCRFIFTVQEELGARGAKTAAFTAAPEIALILEGTSANDFPNIGKAEQICGVGGGVVIPFADKSAVYDKGLYDLLTELADKNNIKRQTKRKVTGGTDAAAVIHSRAGVRTAAVSVAIRNIHSPACVAKISDIEDAFLLTRLFLETAGEIDTGEGQR